MDYKKASEIRLGDYICVYRNHKLEMEFVNVLELNAEELKLHVNSRYWFNLADSHSFLSVAFTDVEEARQHAKQILLEMLQSIENWEPQPLI